MQTTGRHIESSEGRDMNGKVKGEGEGNEGNVEKEKIYVKGKDREDKPKNILT
jgi:hypothetical protein